MLDRWRDLDLGQRRVLATVGSLVVALALVSGVVALTGDSGGKVALRTDQSSTSSSAVTATSADPSGSTTSTGASGSSTTASTAASSTTARGSGSPTTTKAPKAPKGGGSGGTTVTTAASSSTTEGTTATTEATTTTAAGPCNPGGGNANANQIADLFCSYRANHGLAKMTRNSALDSVAQQWAQKMADAAAAFVAANPGADPGQTALQHNVAGNGPTYPGGYSAAVKADCSRCTGWAENVAYDTTVSGGWSDWLGSSAHLTNIADARAGEYGVGVASGGGFLWFAQDFGRYPG